MLLDPVELTESGGGVEYFTVNNEGDAEADLSGFTLQVQDSETGDCSGRMEIARTLGWPLVRGLDSPPGADQGRR